jgi:hypothetical protein
MTCGTASHATIIPASKKCSILNTPNDTKDDALTGKSTMELSSNHNSPSTEDYLGQPEPSDAW